MALVMLKKSRTGTFRRSPKNEKGEVIQVIDFTPGEPVDVPLNCLAALQGDFYQTLFPVYLGPTGKPIIVPRDEFDLEAVLTAPEPVALAPVVPVNNTPPAEPERVEEPINGKRRK